MEEIWKDIIGYEGYYKISNLGRVKSLARNIYYKDGSFSRYKPETIKKNKINTDGYYSITLSVNCHNKTIAIHRLVAQAFIPNPNNLPEVNHKDFNRKNNCVDNLEWCDHKDNVKYSSDNGRFSECHSGLKNGRCRSISAYTPDGKFIKSFDMVQDCAKWLKENFNLKGKLPAICGYINKCYRLNKLYRNMKFIYND